MSFVNETDAAELFSKPQYKTYGKIISFQSVKKAKTSVKKLENKFENARKKKTKLTIARVVQYSTNRAAAAAKNPNLKPATKKRMIKVSEIYKNEAAILWLKYNQLKK